ncbi:hypothetical protein Aoki45_06360 [Algoriphagus sp. oki45]|uniref:AlbA family DNA-binding domain-containing protein n=1 Tax=Algoriphagus sp. oki45 TaxID=3067294 RepID=UPI0027EA1A4F|nr:hypothetical protein Aoki45_06360 [Algoriphagus sp. oki45]
MNPTKFDQDFVKKLIKQKEGKSLDFKNKITSREKIAKTLAAFANTSGGSLLIGVSDRGQVRGIDPEEEKFMIETANREYCNPEVNLSFHEIKLTDTEFLENSNEEEITLLLVYISPSLPLSIDFISSKGDKIKYIRQGDRTIAIRN